MSRFSLWVLAATFASCGGTSDTIQEGGSGAGSGISIVVLDGTRHELETWPTVCGESNGGKDFAIKAGPNNGDDDPANNTLTLSIGGDRNGEPFTVIDFTPPGDLTKSVRLEGSDAVWIDGKRFAWSGSTNAGLSFEVDAECP